MNTRVLIADDHEVVRRAIRETLEGRNGVEIVGEAKDGEEAIQRTWELEPDVLIMDISMPVMNGFKAAEIIKKYRPNTAIVVFSMYDEWASAAQQYGFDGFVSKEENATALLRAIDAVLHGKKYFQN